MTVEDAVTVIFDKVIIYKDIDSIEFENIYKGDRNNIPINVLNMTVSSIGAVRSGVVDIKVFCN